VPVHIVSSSISDMFAVLKRSLDRANHHSLRFRQSGPPLSWVTYMAHCRSPSTFFFFLNCFSLPPTSSQIPGPVRSPLQKDSPLFTPPPERPLRTDEAGECASLLSGHAELFVFTDPSFTERPFLCLFLRPTRGISPQILTDKLWLSSDHPPARLRTHRLL